MPKTLVETVIPPSMIIPRTGIILDPIIRMFFIFLLMFVKQQTDYKYSGIKNGLRNNPLFERKKIV
jgi:hypothetical protein